ncbi:hypothetical protein M758_12G054800 [Ceratodon purpureus]|nr:hypothetical protein M758_12G054800 [Ceratodon purpureus]
MLHLHLLFLLLLLSQLPPSLAAGGAAASNVDTVGFWLGFTLLVIVSSVEAVMSIIWTRLRITTEESESDDMNDRCEYSCRVCGREIFLIAIDPEVGRRMAENVGVFGCCGCGGGESFVGNGKVEMRQDIYGGISLVPYLMIRRFNPAMSLEAAEGLVSNVRVFFKRGDSTVGLRLEHGVHMIVGLMDISLGVAGLAFNPRSPEALYTAIKDPKAPLTFENYSTLFLLYWLLGAVLLICMLPTRSKRISAKLIFGLPSGFAYGVACMASIVLFALGCWKIDVARKVHEDWTPMLSYWIGGATVISVPCCGLEPLHIFGLVGLVFMLKSTF